MKATIYPKQNASSPNEEWPELINAGETTMKMKVRPRAEERVQISLSSKSADDLASIKKRDPFLYYSIPGVRKATMLMRDIDASNLGNSDVERSASSPARMETALSNTKSQIVTRKSAISFECPLEVHMEDLFSSDEDCEEFDEDIMNSLDEDMLEFFASLNLSEDR
mmetsp:Transcript_15285/g.26095  ORF Transcript_15285/g.26095 Transcript_15285/m.26095 type:complete len:167 (-) Transcript_15285:151-651(-)